MNAPGVVAGFLMLIGWGLLVGGVNQLAGLGWACVAAGVPCIVLAAVIMRGLK